LDRDGTINEDVDFVSSPSQLVLIPGSAEAIRRLNAMGFFTVVISNQSGVARGLFTEADLVPIHDRLRELLAREGASIDRIYYCPHHPTEGRPPYLTVCRCRKPAPGMLEDAARDLGIDLAGSFVVGDKLSDVEAGINAGATGILVRTGYGSQIAPGKVPRYVADNLAGAVDLITHTLTDFSGRHETTGS
jgi:D-glycero-D-manno-heptose 1,7-bisphosphate phosphatase